MSLAAYLFCAGILFWLFGTRVGVLMEQEGPLGQVASPWARPLLTSNVGAIVVVAASIYSFWLFDWWVPLGGYIFAVIVGGYVLGLLQHRGLDVGVAVVVTPIGYLLILGSVVFASL